MQQYSFILTFTIFLLLQSVFIILPITAAIQEQQKLPLTSHTTKPTVMKLNEKQNVETTGRVNTSIKSLNNSQRELNDKKREEHATVNNGITSNETTEKIKDTYPDILKTSSAEFQSEPSILSSWTDDSWDIWHPTKLDLQQLLSSSAEYTQNSPRHDLSSIYTAFTDLDCYDYTTIIPHYRVLKQKYIYFLNTYRHHSPFPVYLSVLKSNGPRCYQYYPDSSCASNSKLTFSYLKSHLFQLTQFWLNLSILIIILLVIYKALNGRLPSKKSDQLSNKNQQITLDKTNDLPSQPIPSNINNNHPLNEEIEKELRSGLAREESNEYQNIREACRVALNDALSKQSEQLNVEALRFANAKVHSVSQSSVETIVINAMLDVDHLVFKVTDQTYSIEIPKLTGELQIFLINNIAHYSIDVKFERIQIENAEIIDPNNILSPDRKQSILKLFQETISQTTVRCFYYLSDNQENIISESKTEPCIPPIVPQLPDIDEQCETPVMSSINDNHQHISPKNEAKRLLVRIVKAVKLHDVEQPFCTLELNYPKQTRQTSIAKNGVNPFWDERFLFECNEKSNQIRLQIFDRKKANRKHNAVDVIYADVSIPFSYITSTIYKQDVRITPQHPDSIIRIEFSTLCEEEILAETNKSQHEYQRSPSYEIVTLPYNADAVPKGRIYENNVLNHTTSTLYSTTDTLSTLSPLTSQEDDIKVHKLRKSQSFMSSLRHLSFLRRKKSHKKSKETENGVIPPSNTTAHIDFISPNSSAEPFSSANAIDPKSVHRHRSIRDIFRPNPKNKRLNTSNFITDQPDLLPSPKQRSFFQRFKSKQKHSMDLSTNSLTSYDCTRPESVRNTPVRANVGYPVTMTKPVAQ